MRRGNGDGSIFKLAGKRRKPYAVRVTIGWTNEGKQQYNYIGYYATKTEAKKALEEYNVNPFDLSTKNVTFADIHKIWTETNNLGHNVSRNYKSVYNRCTLLHNKKMREIKITDLKEQMEIFTPSTKKMYKVLINHLYKCANEHEIKIDNLSEYLTYEAHQVKEKTVFTNEEIQKLWNNLDNNFYADIPLILLYSGMRINELLNMELKDVHVDEGYMFVEKSKTKAGIRNIPIHNKIMPLIKNRFESAKGKYLLNNEKGKLIRYNAFARRQWLDVTSAIGVEHTAHETRHTFITQMDKLNVNKVAVKKIVGHTTKSDMTEHYTHKSIDELIEVINQLEY